jgi:2-dehydropantoate 2-reductase
LLGSFRYSDFDRFPEENNLARIAIIGVGAIGSVIAALLQQSGQHELILCTRNPLPELLVETPDGPVDIHAKVVTDPHAAPEVDWVLVATKAYDVATAARWLPRLRATGAPVAVLQNGVEHRERFAPYMPLEAILPVVVDCPAERKSPSHVVQRGIMHLKAPADSLGEAFIHLFAGTPADAIVVPDIGTVAWRKLCHNAVGVLPTILLQPQGVLHDEALSDVARQIVRETIAVGRAEGAELDDSVVEAVIDAYHSAAPDGINSLHADRLAGRPLELDARNGVIVRMGKKHGIPTPANSMAVALLNTMLQSK